MNNKKIKLLKIINIVLLALTLAFIWGQSMIPPSGSTTESSFIKEIVEEVIQSVSGNKTFSIPEVLIRKSAHFLEYAVLGAELTVLFILDLIKKKNTVLISFWKMYVNNAFIGLSVAMIDESIQHFSGRYSSVFDVWLDLVGASFAIIVILAIFRSVFKHNTSQS